MVSAVRSSATSGPGADVVRPIVGADRSRPSLRMLQAAGRKPDPHDPAVVREVAAQFVAELFFAPLLAQMRQFPFGRELASGGQTEAIFGQQLDQRIADRVAASDDALVREIVSRLEQHASAGSNP